MKRDVRITEDTSGWEQTLEYPESESVDTTVGWHCKQPYPIDNNGNFIEGSVPDPEFGKKKAEEKPKETEETEEPQSTELKLEFK